jgi:hydrogenase maturation factor
MCVAGIARIAQIWDEGSARLARLDDGSVVPLAYVPEASVGAMVLVHLGIPVEVIDDESARDALELRKEGEGQ